MIFVFLPDPSISTAPRESLNSDRSQSLSLSTRHSHRNQWRRRLVGLRFAFSWWCSSSLSFSMSVVLCTGKFPQLSMIFARTNRPSKKVRYLNVKFMCLGSSELCVEFEFFVLDLHFRSLSDRSGSSEIGGMVPRRVGLGRP